MLLNEFHSNYCKRVCLFYAKFLLDGFDFLSDFLLKLSQLQLQTAELNRWKFNTKSQLKIAPKRVQFFSLTPNSGIS